MRKTRFNIPFETVLDTKKCTKGHACLIEEDYQLCCIKVTSELHARMVCGKDTHCPYNSRLGDHIVCTCPVRHAIFRKYGR